jgi:VIT1/CCC1 family predicted Fe2+/Mn2+ transporter
VILGLNDGITTTLVFALSVSGASGQYSTVVLAGLAEMFAGGVSMFLGGSIAAQSENEAIEHQIAVERHEIEHEPEEEREELTQIYREKGFTGRQLTGIVDHLTGDKDRWLDSMVREELMVRPEELRRPWQVGAAVGLSFVIGALIPILPFIAGITNAAVGAAVFSIAALFLTGALRSRYSTGSWLRNGAQMVGVGLIGTVAGVIIGRVLHGHT